jgi:hypothetical protein
MQDDQRMARRTSEPQFRGEALERFSRAMRWCILQTYRSARQAARRGHPISPSNQKRMIRRRWSAWVSQQPQAGLKGADPLSVQGVMRADE